MTARTSVLVVGAGPVGATMALLLAKHGVACTVVERRTEPQSHPAAHVLSTRTLEIWREIGIEREVRRISARLHELRHIVYATSLSGIDLGNVPILDLEPEQLGQIESLSPTRAAHLSQNRLEPLLWECLRCAEGIDFRPGVGYMDHQDESDGVRVSLSEPGSPRVETLDCRYLIAADGAASPIRRRLGIAMEGPVLQHMISVHFSADLGRYLWSRRGPVVWTHTPKGPGTIIVHHPPDDLVFQIPYFPPIERVTDFDEKTCRERIHDAIGDRAVDIRIRSIQPWTMTAQVADRYRQGRSFLIGDAAHRFPPTGGLGLNTGVHDAHNLAWKLAWVLNGKTTETVLDSYQSERHPVGVASTRQSVANFDGMLDVLAALGLPKRATRATGSVTSSPLLTRLPRPLARRLLVLLTSLVFQRMRLVRSRTRIGARIRNRVRTVIAGQGGHYRTWGMDLGTCYGEGFVIPDGLPAGVDDVEFYTPRVRPGGRLPHAWVTVEGRRVSTHDLVAPDTLTLLVAGERAPRWRAALTRSGILSIAGVGTATWPTVLGLDHDTALLVRPDGHIAAVLNPWTGTDQSTVDIALAALGFDWAEIRAKTADKTTGNPP